MLRGRKLEFIRNDRPRVMPLIGCSNSKGRSNRRNEAGSSRQRRQRQQQNSGSNSSKEGSYGFMLNRTPLQLFLQLTGSVRALGRYQGPICMLP